jgi:hypothetical protein
MKRRRFAELPVPTADTDAEVISPAGRTVRLRVKAYQVRLWVSVSPLAWREHLPSGAPCFAPVLDTGNSHHLTLREADLASSPKEFQWSIDEKRPLGLQEGEVKVCVPRLLDHIWIHSNLPDWTGGPYRLRIGANGGMNYFPAKHKYHTEPELEGYQPKMPHVPLLGLRALCAASIGVEFDCHPAGGTIVLLVPDDEW